MWSCMWYVTDILLFIKSGLIKTMYVNQKGSEVDRLQQGRRNGSEVTQKGKLNTEMELTVRIVNLSDCTRDTHFHCCCSSPWRVPHCCIFKDPVEGSLCSPFVIIQEHLCKAGPKGRVAFQQPLRPMCLIM